MTPKTVAILGVLGLIAWLAGILALTTWSAERQEAARQARYETCLTRTTPDVCELHLVRHIEFDRSGPEPQLIISPSGKVNLGIGL